MINKTSPPKYKCGPFKIRYIQVPYDNRYIIIKLDNKEFCRFTKSQNDKYHLLDRILSKELFYESCRIHISNFEDSIKRYDYYLDCK
jgi:predicted GH43/DUF377 family glycosyl hydrolase